MRENKKKSMMIQVYIILFFKKKLTDKVFMLFITYKVQIEKSLEKLIHQGFKMISKLDTLIFFKKP